MKKKWKSFEDLSSREAIEKAYTDVTPKEDPAWITNDNLLKWLKSF